MIQPSEKAIVGNWIVENGQVVADAVAKRVQSLTAEYLEKVAGGGWDTLYRDPIDGRYWELTFPKSDWHGGGPPALICISREEAEKKYGEELCH